MSNTWTGACGPLCSVCPSALNATSTCDGRSCGYNCNAGFADCNGLDIDGCEVDLRTSNAHCGTCRRACAMACVAGSCASIGPSNDLAAGAIPLSMAGLGTTVIGTTVNATNQGGCGSGGDVYYSFTLLQREVVYVDTYGSPYDTEVAFAAGHSGNLACNDDSCASLQSQLVSTLAAGTWYVVVGGFGSQTGAFSLHFQHLPAGNGTITNMTQGVGLVISGTTSGMGAVSSTCGYPNGPENMYYYVTCPTYRGGTFSASTCGRAAWDTQIYFKQGNGTEFCNDDSVCNGPFTLQSTLTGTVSAGAALRGLYIDGYRSESGSYSILYTMP